MNTSEVTQGPQFYYLEIGTGLPSPQYTATARKTATHLLSLCSNNPVFAYSTFTAEDTTVLLSNPEIPTAGNNPNSHLGLGYDGQLVSAMHDTLTLTDNGLQLWVSPRVRNKRSLIGFYDPRHIPGHDEMLTDFWQAKSRLLSDSTIAQYGINKDPALDSRTAMRAATVQLFGNLCVEMAHSRATWDAEYRRQAVRHHAYNWSASGEPPRNITFPNLAGLRRLFESKPPDLRSRIVL